MKWTWLGNLTKRLRRTPRNQSPKPRHSQLRVEILEDRTVPTLTNFPPNIDISNQAGAQSETGISINPTNPLNLVSVANDITNLNHLATYFSTNGGATWTTRFIDNTVDGFGAGETRFDPNVAFDSDGNVYVLYSMNGAGGANNSRLVVAQSTDGGNSFTQITQVTSDATAGGATLHTANLTTRAAAGNDAVAVVWAHVVAGGERIETALSTDAGATFPTTNLAVNDAVQRTFMPSIAVDIAGAFHVTWEVNNPAKPPDGQIFHDVLNATTLASGADTLVSNVQITDFTQATSMIPAQPDRGIFSVSTIDVDRSSGSFNGRIYVSYADRVNTATNDLNVFIRFSDNGGTTWSAPVQINDDGTTSSQFLPRMGVDQSSGRLVAVWYDARNNAVNNQQVEVFGSDSTNGGATWSANTRISDQPSNESTTNAARDGNNYGEYIGLAVFQGVAHPIWTDGRAANFTGGLNEEVFTAFVSALPPGLQVTNGVLNLCGDQQFANQDDTFRIVRNAANNQVLDIFINNTSATPTFQVPLALVNKINVFAAGGNDNLIVDSSNGLINVPNGIRYDGDNPCPGQVGAGFGGSDRLDLSQTGGGTQTSDTLAVGSVTQGMVAAPSSDPAALRSSISRTWNP